MDGADRAWIGLKREYAGNFRFLDGTGYKNDQSLREVPMAVRWPAGQPDDQEGSGDCGLIKRGDGLLSIDDQDCDTWLDHDVYGLCEVLES